MNYTIHQLQVFLKVVQHQSVTKAAEDLYMTQPAASIQLKNFQDQFDIPLTEVIGRQLFVTDFGREIAAIAERVMDELGAIQYKTDAYKGILTGKLRVSSASTGKYVIPFFLAGFMNQHVGVDLLLDVTNKTKVVESLRRNEIDFAMVSVLPDNVPVEEELLIENKLYLFGHQPEKTDDTPLIYREEGSATRAAMESYFSTPSRGHRKRMELTSNEAVKQAVLAGLGNSIMPLIGLHNELENQQLFVLPSPGLPITTEWRLVWLKGKKLSPIAQAYLDYVRQTKQQVLEENFAWYQSY